MGWTGGGDNNFMVKTYNVARIENNKVIETNSIAVEGGCHLYSRSG